MYDDGKYIYGTDVVDVIRCIYITDYGVTQMNVLLRTKFFD